MGIVYTINRDNAEVTEILKFIQDNSANIKDFAFGLRFTNGNLVLNCDQCSVETLCTLNKMIDIRIDELLLGERLTSEEDEEEGDEESE